MESIKKDRIAPASQLISFAHPICIEVGREDRIDRFFTIEANLLTSRSAFFKNALSSKWTKTKDRVLKLPDDEIDTVALYLHFVIKDNLPVIPDPVPALYAGYEESIKLAKLYIFAERIQDVKAKNASLQSLIVSTYEARHDGRWRWPSLAVVGMIYDGTPPGSMARKFLIDVFLINGVGSWISNKEDWPQDFLHELAMAFMDRTREFGPHNARTDGGLQYLETETKEDA